MFKRGEWYVVLQLFLTALVICGPTGPALIPFSVHWFSILLIIPGLGLLLAGTWHLGRNLTPLPHPRDDSRLVRSGPYALVRHPLYSGIIFTGFAWALWVQGLFTLIYAAALSLFFDIKAREEEKLLNKRYWNYGRYQRRVKKLIPFVY